MEYQKTLNVLDNTSNQPSKFKTKSWVEVGDESGGCITKTSKLHLKLQC